MIPVISGRSSENSIIYTVVPGRKHSCPFVILKKCQVIKALERGEPVTRYNILKTIARMASRNVQSLRNGS